MNTSSVSLASSGNLPQPSAQAVARPSIPIVEGSSTREKIVTAFLLSLMDQTNSGDCMELAVYSAQELCKELGIKEEEFNDVLKSIYETWCSRRRRNPINGLF